MKVWKQCFAVVALVAVIAGCTSGGGGEAGSEPSAAVPQAVSTSVDGEVTAPVPQASAAAKAVEGTASDVATGQPAVPPSDAEGSAVAPVLPKPTLADKLQRTRPASGEAAGLDSFKDFEGKRIGFVHTANVVGEIDPCG